MRRGLATLVAVVATLLGSLWGAPSPASASANPPGVDWSLEATPVAVGWSNIAYGQGMCDTANPTVVGPCFVAVANSGGLVANRIMTSPDGITWTARANPVDGSNQPIVTQWQDVVYANGLWVAVGSRTTAGQYSPNGAGKLIMTSPNAITWTAQSSPLDGSNQPVDNQWTAVTYGEVNGVGTYVALADTGASHRVATSTNGTMWTAHNYAVSNTRKWASVAYGEGRCDSSQPSTPVPCFVAVAQATVGNRIMTSPDGLTWTSRADPSPSATYTWGSVTYGNGTFVAVSVGGPAAVMRSSDGDTWQTSSGAPVGYWYAVAFGDPNGNPMFASVALTGTDRVMISPPAFTVTFDPNGGSGTMTSMRANVPTALPANTFTNTGMVFAGWNTVAGGGGTSYANGAVYPFEATRTLYAQWVSPPPPSPGRGGGNSGGTGEPVVVATPSPTPAPVAPVDPLLPLLPNTGGGNGSGDGVGVIPDGGLNAGQSLLLVGGTPAPVIVRPNRQPAAQATGLNVVGGGFTMTVATHDNRDRPLNVTSGGALVLPSSSPRGTVTVTGLGFKPGTPVKVFILDNIFVGELTVNADGTVQGRLQIPPGIPAGRHTLQINGFTPDDVVRSLSFGVVVRASGVNQPTRTADAQVFFAPLSATITSQGKTTLDALADRVGRLATRSVVIGFVQPAGTMANDKTLSTARARAVASYLRAGGVTGAYVVSGKGRAKINSAHSRRVDVTITYQR